MTNLPLIAIIDYGMGNLRSVQKAFEQIGAKATITQSSRVIHEAQKVVLPGVGAMKPAMDKLKGLKLIPAIEKFVDSGRPFLGICLGLQLLFEESNEGGKVRGLGILPGKVRRFQGLKVPHMGWNQIILGNADCPLLKDVPDFSYMYFCHSYFIKPKDPALMASVTSYGKKFVSSIQRGNIFGVQFHPEKSQSNGLKILKNFERIRP